MGGYHVTLCPDETEAYSDSIIIGNAETVFKTVLDDFQRGELKQRYYGNTVSFDVLPDKSIFRGKYLPVSLVETGRGVVIPVNSVPFQSIIAAAIIPEIMI